MTASLDNAAANLRMVVFMFVSHNLVNSMLLSAWNPVRCVFWNRAECSVDENWICNWLSLSNLHVTMLLGSMALSATTVDFENKLAHLCCAILMVRLAGSIHTVDILNKSISAIQCGVYALILGAILYFTLKIEQHMPVSFHRVPKKSTSHEMRWKLPVATISLALCLSVVVFQVVDMTFGSGRSVYLGDASSPVYKSMENMAVCEMMVPAMILLFALRFCTAQQQKMLLQAHAMFLFISLIMLTTEQGEKIEAEANKAGCIGTFFFLLIALLGAL